MVILKCDKCKQEVGTNAKPKFRSITCNLNKPTKDTYGAFVPLSDAYILCDSCYDLFKAWKGGT